MPRLNRAPVWRPQPPSNLSVFEKRLDDFLRDGLVNHTMGFRAPGNDLRLLCDTWHPPEHGCGLAAEPCDNGEALMGVYDADVLTSLLERRIQFAFRQNALLDTATFSVEPEEFDDAEPTPAG